MYLLNTTSLKLKDFLPTQRPPYIILSHTWEDEEVLFQDITQRDADPTQIAGWAKVLSFCELVRRDGWEWVWLDTLCIDKRSSAELSEAINSMFQWYQDAEYCAAYLADISLLDHHTDGAAEPKKLFHESRWFTRGWTLQELLAPREVMFYDQGWRFIGSKHSLEKQLCRATKIMPHHLESTFRSRNASAAVKMSWASQRHTSRPEDAAYSLLGLFDVSMPLLYGEGGKRAFWRLQQEIISKSSDESIFAWVNTDASSGVAYGNNKNVMLAPDPYCFSSSGDIVPIVLGKLSTPRIRYDGLWHVERRSRRRKPQSNSFGQKHYEVPLACASISNLKAPLMLVLSGSVESSDMTVSRPPSLSFEFFDPKDIHSRHGWKVRKFSILHEVVFRLGEPLKLPLTRFTGFCISLPTAAQRHFHLTPSTETTLVSTRIPNGREHLISSSRDLSSLKGSEHRISAREESPYPRESLGVNIHCNQEHILTLRLHQYTYAQHVTIESKESVLATAWPSWRRGLSKQRSRLFPGDHLWLPYDDTQGLWITQRQGLEENKALMILILSCDLEVPDIYAPIFASSDDSDTRSISSGSLSAEEDIPYRDLDWRNLFKVT